MQSTSALFLSPSQVLCSEVFCQLYYMKLKHVTMFNFMSIQTFYPAEFCRSSQVFFCLVSAHRTCLDLAVLYDLCNAKLCLHCELCLSSRLPSRKLRRLCEAVSLWWRVHPWRRVWVLCCFQAVLLKVDTLQFCSNRLILAGYRYIKIAKSPMSATIAFNYEVTAAGIEQIGDDTFDASDGGRNMIQWLVPYPPNFLSISKM